MVGMKAVLSISLLLAASGLRLNDEEHANVTASANVTEVANVSTEAKVMAVENSTVGANTSTAGETNTSTGSADESEMEAAIVAAGGSVADSTPTADSAGYTAVKQAYDTLMAEEPATPLEWTYFPNEPRLGIAMGGLPEDFQNNSFAQLQALMLLRYAKKKGYALYVDKNVSRQSGRNYNWNKIPIMHKLLDDVPYLVWMDSNVVITDLVFSLEGLLKRSQCQGAHQLEWADYFPAVAQPETFLWMGADMHQTVPAIYKVNAAAGVIGLRRCEKAKDFLRKVWAVGDAPNYWQRHHYAADARRGEVGEWPYDLGAFWDVLALAPNYYMKGACVVPVGGLHSLTSQIQKTSKLRRLRDDDTYWRNKIVLSYFDKIHMKDWVF